MSKETNKEVIENFRRKIENIMRELLKRDTVEVFGKLKVEIANIDTPALIKRNKIYVNISVKDYPDYILKYIIAHEIAHLAVKKHTKKFWEIVKNIYPEYEKARADLLKKLER